VTGRGDITNRPDDYLQIGSRFGDIVKMENGLFVNLAKCRAAVETLPGVAHAIVTMNEDMRTLDVHMIPKQDHAANPDAAWLKSSDPLSYIKTATESLTALYRTEFGAAQILWNAPENSMKPEHRIYFTGKGAPSIALKELFSETSGPATVV
jgi:hypothetical protein